MTETSVFLEVTTGKYGTVTHNLPFANMDVAMEALAAIEPKIGGRFHNDPEKSRHRFHSMDGSFVVSVEDVLSVRVIDRAVFRAAVISTETRMAELHGVLRAAEKKSFNNHKENSNA